MKRAFIFACMMFWSVVVQAALVEVGKVDFFRGSCAAQQEGDAARMLGAGASIYEGDNIQTAERSFVVLAFNDGSKVTVRPNSSFSVKTFSMQPGQESAKMQLHIGGVHAQTGTIASTRADAFNIQTPLGDAKAQNASYSVRLCEADCQSETQNDNVAQPGVVDDSPVAARVVDVKNLVVAVNQSVPDDATRNLSVGSPIYTSDKLTSYEDSYAALVFRDGTKFTLQGNSELVVSQFDYQKAGTEDKAVYDLVTGGLRVLTGAIGKKNKENFNIKTGVATIGIRGTGFDLNCREACASAQAGVSEPRELVLGGNGSGLYSYVWDSAITQTNDTGTFTLVQGNSNYIASRSTPPVPVPQPPVFFMQNPSPRPDNYHPDMQQMFTPTQVDRTLDVPPGLYVHVDQGLVSMEKAAESDIVRVTLQAGQAGYSGTTTTVVTLDSSKSFQLQDPFPRPARFDPVVAEQGGYSLLKQNVSSYRDSGYSCVAQ